MLPVRANTTVRTEKAQHDQILHQVVAGQHGAEFFVAGMELDQCVEGHDEQAAGDSEQQKVEGHRPGGLELRQQCQAQQDAQGAQGHQAGFDVVSGSASGDQRADDDTESGAGHHALDDQGVVQPQGLLGEGGEGGQHHLRDAPEHRQADDGEPDGAARGELAEVFPQVAAPGVSRPVEGLIVGGYRACGQLQGQPQFQSGAQHQDPADRGDQRKRGGLVRVVLSAQAGFEQQGEDHDAGEDGDDGERLNQGVDPGQARLSGQLLDETVLGRGVESALNRQQKGHAEGDVEPALVVAESDQQGQAQGHDGADSHHPGLAVAVRDETGGGEQKDEGQQNQAVDERGKNDLGRPLMDLEDRVLNDDLVSQIDKGVEKGDEQERQKARCFEYSVHDDMAPVDVSVAMLEQRIPDCYVGA